MKGFTFSETFVIPDMVVKWLWRVGDPRLTMPHLHPWVSAFAGTTAVMQGCPFAGMTTINQDDRR